MPDSTPQKTTFPLPRGLIMLSCLWITGAWILSMGPRGPLNSLSDDHAEGLRMFSVTLMLGITIAWPMSRLLLVRFNAPIRQSLLDCIVLICSVEVTLWPLRLLSEWSVDRTLSITNVLAGWILLMGAFVALGAATRGWTSRILIVLGATVLTVCSPLLTDGDQLLWWNPVDLTLGVSTIDPNRLFGMSPWPGRTAVVQLLLAVIGAWTFALGARVLNRTRNDDLAISRPFE